MLGFCTCICPLLEAYLHLCDCTFLCVCVCIHTRVCVCLKISCTFPDIPTPRWHSSRFHHMLGYLMVCQRETQGASCCRKICFLFFCFDQRTCLRFYGNDRGCCVSGDAEPSQHDVAVSMDYFTTSSWVFLIHFPMSVLNVASFFFFFLSISLFQPTLYLVYNPLELFSSSTPNLLFLNAVFFSFSLFLLPFSVHFLHLSLTPHSFLPSFLFSCFLTFQHSF